MIHKKVYFLTLFYFSTIFQANGERTKDKMYERIDGTAACFRRLNATHQIGCSSNRPGSTGVIHIVNNQSDLRFIIDKLDSGPYMAVMPVTLLTKENMDLITTNLDKISGIITHNNITRPSSYSLEAKCPNEGYGLKKDMCDSKESWNPVGQGVLRMDYPFPIFLLNDEENLEKLSKCFLKYNNFDFENQGKRPLCSLEMQSFMFAAVNSPTCMRRGNTWTFTPVHYCDPLGDRNIWSTLYPWKNETNRVKDVILVMTRMDTTSLFNDVYPGAESSVTGLVTLLSIAEMLHRITANKPNFKKNVFFVIFNGESYDYIGSQRFVYDIINKKFPMEKDDNVKNLPAHLNLDDIKLIVEIGQVAKGKNLFMHHLKNESTDAKVNAFKTNLTKNFLPMKIKNASQRTKIPPTSIQSFLEEDPSLPTLLITNHDQTFTNMYYNSIYDDIGNINFEYVNVTEEQVDPNTFNDTLQQWIANIATATAKTIYQEIYEESYVGEEKAKPFYVNELLNCYINTANCKIYKAVSMKEYIDERPLSLYVGVVASSNIQTALTARALAWLTGNIVNKEEKECMNDAQNPVHQYIWMSSNLENVSMGACYETTMNFTLAVSPAFEVKDYDWESGRYSSWTESVWKDFSVRMYLKPSMRHEIVTLSIGTIILVVSMQLVHFIYSRSDILFPKQQNANSIPPIII